MQIHILAVTRGETRDNEIGDKNYACFSHKEKKFTKISTR